MTVKRMAGAAFSLAFICAGPAFGEDVPYAQGANPAPGQFRMEYLPTLGDIMESVQSRHAKLWFAGRAGNWPLASYEISQIKNGLDRAAVLYANIPVDEIARAGKPLRDLTAATESRDGAAFATAFGELTNACNACHISGDIGFIRIQTPKSPALGNQSFAP